MICGHKFHFSRVTDLEPEVRGSLEALVSLLAVLGDLAGRRRCSGITLDMGRGAPTATLQGFTCESLLLEGPPDP